MGKFVASLISRLEETALGIVQSGKDAAEAMEQRKYRGVALLIRPFASGGKFQLCFIFGDAKWRRRRSMHVNLARLTFLGEASLHSACSNIVDFSCSCMEYRASNTCLHKEATFNNVSNKMRILTLASRNIRASLLENSTDDWECLRIPALPRDDVSLWQVYRRRHLSSTFSTSATVLLDMRKSRLRKPHRDRLICSACPGVAKNRMLCAHETAALKHIPENASISSDVTGEVNAVQENPRQGFWNTIMDEENSEELSPDDDTIGAEGNNDCTSDPANAALAKEICYASTRQRFFFPCPSDDAALDKLLRIVNTTNSISTSSERVPRFIGIDEEAKCPNCGVDVKLVDYPITFQRNASLHTLHHGTIDIQVTDFFCRDCRQYIPYDGYTDALFGITKHQIFTRELLDAWLWDLCGTGGTFRDVFSSWFTQSLSHSASFHRLGREIDANRQRGNEAFSAFLKTLKFPQDDDLYSLFSCKKCEREPRSESRDLAAIVMDGTALGILGTLPTFNRETRIISPVPRIPDKQYIMRKPKLRAFVDAILTSAKGAGGLEYFNVPLKLSIWRKKSELESQIFQYAGGLHHEAFVVGKFMNACFAPCHNNGSEVSDGEESDVGNGLSLRRMRFRNKFLDVDVRRSLIEFGRCFLVGSIPGGVLRNTISVNISANLSSAMRDFFSCNHIQMDGVDINVPVCESCSQALFHSGRRAEEIVSSAARFACAVAQASTYSNRYELRYLSSVAADIIDSAIATRAKYNDEFEINQGEDVRFYNATHRNGTGLNEPTNEDWLVEAQRTGEFFPGRPQVRPRMDFGRSARTENARSCRKVYTKSETHSPGIFTVQCVCSHPKLIGISVMEECEGVSTALSVLLARFRRLPRVCYYDNACNMSKSIILRCPWVNDECIIVCDRFHYHAHTCNSIWDPASYPSCADHATSGAESINHIWNFSKSHLRFLRPDNMMPFLATRAIFVNIRAFREFVRNKWKCSCDRCVSQAIL